MLTHLRPGLKLAVRSASALALLAALASFSAAEEPVLLDAAGQKQKALDAEKAGEPRAALDAWYRLLDSCRASDDARHEAMKHVHELLPKVPAAPERDATVWRVKALVFTHLRFKEVDRQLSAAERADVKASFQRFAALVLEFTHGCLRIEADFEEVETPVTRLSGDTAFFATPDDLTYDFGKDGFAKGRFDSVIAYVCFGDAGKRVAQQMLGGTFGGDVGPQGAGYSALTYLAGDLAGRTGEVELHEWLHQVDWMFFRIQGYPDGFFASPDEGRMVDAPPGDGDPCAPRRAKDGKDWFPFYRHMMEDHATDRMWRAASMLKVTPNPWNQGDVREWMVSAPVAWKGEPGAGLRKEISFKEGSRVCATGADRTLHFDKLWPEATGLLVAAAEVSVFVPETTDVILFVGSDDGCAVSIDGRPVFEAAAPRGLTIDQDQVKAKLEKGWHRVRVTVEQVGGGWGVSLRVADAEGVPPRGLRIAAVEPK